MHAVWNKCAYSVFNIHYNMREEDITVLQILYILGRIDSTKLAPCLNALNSNNVQQYKNVP